MVVKSGEFVDSYVSPPKQTEFFVMELRWEDEY